MLVAKPLLSVLVGSSLPLVLLLFHWALHLFAEEHIGQLDSELARMNELMKESSESPDVTAELARLIKSGLTYSQLYHKYHQTAEQLTLEKAENGRLNDCLNTLIKVSTCACNIYMVVCLVAFIL